MFIFLWEKPLSGWEEKLGTCVSEIPAGKAFLVFFQNGNWDWEMNPEKTFSLPEREGGTPESYPG